MSDMSDYFLLAEETDNRYNEVDGNFNNNRKKINDNKWKLSHKWMILRMLYNEYCPICAGRDIKSKMIERNGKYGKFEGCSRYPNCKYTQYSKENYGI